MIEAVGRYHALTKHRPERFAPGPDRLDWSIQPDPFRRFADAETIALPLVAGEGLCDYDALYRRGGAPLPLDLRALGLFLELALGLSAWKVYGAARWSLRNNPSSGNLHPSEAYLVVPAAQAGGPPPGVYHYAPMAHALETRRRFAPGPAPPEADGRLLVGLASVHWREAWKYGERAFRYCQHDAGHALAALRFAARVLGWTLRLAPEAGDAEIAALLGLDRAGDFPEGEEEAPDFLCVLDPRGRDISGPPPLGMPSGADGGWSGPANRLSAVTVLWPSIEEAAEATRKDAGAPPPWTPPEPAGRRQEPPTRPADDAARIIRRRRSAVAMDGATGLARAAFLRMLARTMPDPARPPWDAFPLAPAVHLALFVHRVADLAPGLYWLARDPSRLDAARAATSPELAWEPVDEAGLPLFALTVGVDARPAAALVSCRQAIAGDGAFALAMIAEFDRTLAREGAWAYRRLHWECGLIGQVLYLEAEAVGLRATGIGCFFDDAMHGVLGLAAGRTEWQSLYHFTTGGAVEDDRLQTEPAYARLGRERVP